MMTIILTPAQRLLLKEILEGVARQAYMHGDDKLLNEVSDILEELK